MSTAGQLRLSTRGKLHRRYPPRATLPASHVAALAALALMAGCTHVISPTTPYYTDGPAQLDPPQGELLEGTPVRVIGTQGTYTRVWTRSGLRAYVWNGALVTMSEWKAIQARRSAAEPKPAAGTEAKPAARGEMGSVPAPAPGRRRP